MGKQKRKNAPQPPGLPKTLDQTTPPSTLPINDRLLDLPLKRPSKWKLALYYLYNTLKWALYPLIYLAGPEKLEHIEDAFDQNKQLDDLINRADSISKAQLLLEVVRFHQKSRQTADTNNPNNPTTRSSRFRRFIRTRIAHYSVICSIITLVIVSIAHLVQDSRLMLPMKINTKYDVFVGFMVIITFGVLLAGLMLLIIGLFFCCKKCWCGKWSPIGMCSNCCREVFF